MSLQIGQIRKNSVPQDGFLTDLSANISDDVTIVSQGFDSNSSFNDYGIYLTSSGGVFEQGTSYYLRFAVRRRERANFLNENTTENVAEEIAQLQFTLSLYTDSNNHELGTFQDIAKNIVVDPIIYEGDEELYRYFEVIFTPNKNYRYLAFVLKRIGYDYRETPRTISSEDIIIIDQEEEEGEEKLGGDLAIINNILPSNKVMDQIGIQTEPGTLLCINGEDIRVGRSGTYEINNGLKIYFVGIVCPDGDDSDNVNDFILDYAYNNE